MQSAPGGNAGSACMTVALHRPAHGRRIGVVAEATRRWSNKCWFNLRARWHAGRLRWPRPSLEVRRCAAGDRLAGRLRACRWWGGKTVCAFGGSGWLICLSVRLFPTHSACHSCLKGEGFRPRPHPVSALRFAALRAAACGRALVSCLAVAVHASRRNRRADFFNHHTRPPA